MLEFVDDELILRAALDAQLERTTNAEFEVYAFNSLLRAAIDTEYISKLGSRRSAGLDWMRSKKTEPEAFDRLVGATRSPLEMFTLHNEYNPHISDVVCSCLFETFIPQDVRDDFARSTVLKWGAKKVNWTRFAVFGGLASSTQAEITYRMVTAKTALMDQGHYVRYLTAGRPQDMWDTSREWSILDDTGTFNLALACLSFAPKAALEKSVRKHVALVTYLEHVLGKPTVRYLIEKALENYSATRGKTYTLESFIKKPAVKTEPSNKQVAAPSTPASESEGIAEAPRKSLDAHIDEALKTGVIHKLKRAVSAHSADKTFVDDYRTHYYKRIKQSGSRWTKQALNCFRSALQEIGWHTGTVLFEEWQGTPRPYIHVPFRGKDIRYVQRVGTYMPNKGEEVLYKPRHGFGIALDLYVVTFLPLEK